MATKSLTVTIPKWFFEPDEQAFLDLVLGTMIDNEHDKAKAGEDARPDQAQEIADDWCDGCLRVAGDDLVMVHNYIECLIDDGAYADLMDTQQVEGEWSYRKARHVFATAVWRHEHGVTR